MMQVPNAKQILKQLLESKVTTVSLRDSCLQSSEQFTPKSAIRSHKKQHSFTINVISGSQIKPILRSNAKYAKFTLTTEQQQMQQREHLSAVNGVDQKVKSLQEQLQKMRKEIVQYREKQKKVKEQYEGKVKELEKKLNQQNETNNELKDKKIKEMCENCKMFMKTTQKLDKKSNKSTNHLQERKINLSKNVNITMLQSQQINGSTSLSSKFSVKKPRKGSINTLKHLRKIVVQGNSQNNKAHLNSQDLKMQLSFCSQHSIIDGLNTLDQLDN